MKTVLLIGDSTMFGSTVSGGYGIYLANRYTVFEMGEVLLPNENCQDTRFTLNTFDEIFAEHKDRLSQVDLVHWNNGLWDTLHFLGNPRATVPIERYLKNLSEIHKLLLEKCPHAKIAFATSTPVDEGQNGKTYRTNAEIRDYNLGACRLLSAMWWRSANFPILQCICAEHRRQCSNRLNTTMLLRRLRRSCMSDCRQSTRRVWSAVVWRWTLALDLPRRWSKITNCLQGCTA